MRRFGLPMALGMLMIRAPMLNAVDVPDQVEFFETRVRPILMGTCAECHSDRKSESSLRLDARDRVLAGGKRGPAIVPGDPANSLLIQAVGRTHPKLEMPPERPLPKRVVENFKRWVAMGAPWPEDRAASDDENLPGANRWVFRARRKVTSPSVRNGKWVQNPIDRFILARLEARGLKPSDHADRRTLIRRATFDLTGLPPTREQVEAFLTDQSPDAFEKVVERLLASPSYGQRWGRHWLDLARYADTSGDGTDMPVPEAYLYRNYVIRAMNQDLPYNQFLMEQIAGDRMAYDDPGSDRAIDRIIATGFIAMSRRFGNGKYSDMHLVIENTIDTIGKSILGMSLACARCHDHKFDPITRSDYYGLYGYFSSTRYPHAGSEHGRARRNFVPLSTDPDTIKNFARFDEARAKVIDQSQYGALDKKMQQKLADLRKQVSPMPVAWAVVDGDQTGDTRVQMAGEPQRLGGRVPRGYLDIINPDNPKIEAGRSGRMALARWIASDDNPLTARVMANRIWQYHMGTGIVTTSNTFGTQGRVPTHPRLLEWLANTFVNRGWSIKTMHRLIMLSAMYQMSSASSKASLATDPNNELYWRYHRRRLDADAIRDAILCVSGTLDESSGGPYPFPPHEKANFTQHRPFTKTFDHDRRSVFLMRRRLGKHPFMALFDGPDANAATAHRRVSTVPLQALFLMNSPFIREKSEAFANRIMQMARDNASRVMAAYELAYARAPSAAEREQASDYLDDYRQGLPASVKTTDRPRLAWVSFCRVLMLNSEFVYVD